MALFATVSADSKFRRGVRAANSDYVPPTHAVSQTTARPVPLGPNEARFGLDSWDRTNRPPRVGAQPAAAAPLPARKLEHRPLARHEQDGGRFSKVYGKQRRSRDIEVPWG